MKKLLSIVLSASLILGVTSCGSNSTKNMEDASAKKSIVVGFCPGPYGDMFKEAIEPTLVADGYTVSYKEFNDYVQPNMALSSGDLDVNLFQHQVYLKKFSEDRKLDLTAIAVVPTAGAGLYSTQYKKLEDVKDGDTVTISDDVTNLARALRILKECNLITFKEGTNPAIVTLDDVDQNIKNLKIVPVSAAQTPRTLDSAQLSVVNGNYAIGAKMDLSKALYSEKLSEDTKNVIVVRTEDKDSKLVSEIQKAVSSPEFSKVIDDPANIFSTFQKPEKQLY